MISVTLSQLATILGADVSGELTFDAVTTDTRKITPGCLFVALKGERFDAHDFAGQAKAAGAGALLVSRKLDIDLPQAVDAAANNHAQSMFERDVNNITEYYGQFAPKLLKTRYGKEIWMLYEDGKLTPETPLTGLFVEDVHDVDMDSLLDEIVSAEDEYYERQRAIREREED